ncbi:TIM-barrel domain-containing protein [Pedobacter nutrimenti]|uniref:glycoside hydrolase family 31 protein n=1 Tax=Pedobacter nutrimenti TaxID=1241337 RepID=UPI00292EECD5|nr:TIM-barrel domain-containing protein [Pedobacter nutrimenti]
MLIFLLLLSQVGMSQSYNRTKTGLKTTVNGIDIELQLFGAGMVRVIKSPQGIPFKKSSLSVVKEPETIPFKIEQKGNMMILQSDKLQVNLNSQTGKLSFKDRKGISLLTEKDYSVQFTPVKDVDKDAFIVRQAFLLDKDEVIYGLGQQQNGSLNQRGRKIYLRQDNMKVAIPFFQSTKGYGIFWDNYSATTFTDNPQETSLESEIGDCADYYFLLGGNADGVIAQMRQLTGQAPMMPLWFLGFNQSRERYQSEDELLGVVAKYRSIGVPLDGIIQDWQYWGDDSKWNAMSFDKGRYPHPQMMVDSVHKMKAHIFVVAWASFGPETPQFAELKKKNMLFQDFETYPSVARPYDVYNPKARDIYWDYLNKGVFSLNTDGWWLDSSEPDHGKVKDDLQTYLGSYRSVLNAFPLQHVGGVYDHQRKTTNAKRVAIFTRSAFAGQQRYGACTWSGDVHSNWKTFRLQIPAGLNFSLCGIPYWNTDIGGFFAGFSGGTKNADFRELYTRWMQFATFTPMMRSHGTGIPREIYEFGQRGDTIFDAQEKYINLRYQLLPYIYSTAWGVTNRSGSFIRALFMDFVNDKKVYNIDNEFMFGQSILVTPVTEKGTRMQKVYLPSGTTWYDFWTNEKTEGGKTVSKATPIDILPLYVKAGSILPFGQKVQYAEEKKWDELEIRIYPGTNGSFTLYEDENNSYNYEKGIYSTIGFKWSEKDSILTIGDRKGDFPGMLQNRTFKIVLVGKSKGNGADSATSFDKIIVYKGQSISVKFK